MKISEITVATLKEWLGISDGEDDILSAVLAAAKQKAVSFTGLTLDELEKYEDVSIAIIGICNDFYINNRPDTAQIGMNPMSEMILQMYSENFL